MDFYCENFQKQNTGSSLKQICALLVIYGIFRNSGNSKWNFCGIGHNLPNLTTWDIFPTQFQSLSSILYSEFVNSNSLGIPVKFQNSQWNFKKLTWCMIWGVNSTYFQALSSILQAQLTILQKLRNSREKYIYRQVKIKIYFKFLQLCINDNMGCKFEPSAQN